MAEIDESTVRRVAELARLELEEDEVERLVEELGSILSHFEQLEEVELEEGEELERDGPPVTRADAPGTDPLAFGPGEMAPDWRGGYFVVPRLPGLGDPGDREAEDPGGPEGEAG